MKMVVLKIFKILQNRHYNGIHKAVFKDIQGGFFAKPKLFSIRP